jgi:hydrogenase expression/formation protein HypC
MCLGIPGRIVEIVDAEGRIAKADVGGVRRNVGLDLLDADDVRVGDWILIHVGFALAKIDPERAAETQRFLRGLGESGDP